MRRLNINTYPCNLPAQSTSPTRRKSIELLLCFRAANDVILYIRRPPYKIHDIASGRQRHFSFVALVSVHLELVLLALRDLLSLPEQEKGKVIAQMLHRNKGPLVFRITSIQYHTELSRRPSPRPRLWDSTRR